MERGCTYDGKRAQLLLVQKTPLVVTEVEGVLGAMNAVAVFYDELARLDAAFELVVYAKSCNVRVVVVKAICHGLLDSHRIRLADTHRRRDQTGFGRATNVVHGVYSDFFALRKMFGHHNELVAILVVEAQPSVEVELIPLRSCAPCAILDHKML